MKNINYNVLIAIIIVIAAYKLLQKIGLMPTSGDRAAQSVGKKGGATDPLTWTKGTKKQPLSTKTVDRLATQIYEAKGMFNDDDENVIAAVRELKTKKQASFLTAYFSKKYKKDMSSYLSFLDDENKVIVFGYLNSLR